MLDVCIATLLSLRADCLAGHDTTQAAVQQPTSIQLALKDRLTGTATDPSASSHVPVLAACKSACVQRSVDLLHLYGLFATGNAACNKLLAQALQQQLQSATVLMTAGSDLAAAGLEQQVQQAVLSSAHAMVLAMVEQVGAQCTSMSWLHASATSAAPCCTEKAYLPNAQHSQPSVQQQCSQQLC